MTFDATRFVRIGRSDKFHLRLGMGGSFYGLDRGYEQGEAGYLAALETALAHGITHFDTGAGYGDGNSERMIGRFMAADSRRREHIRDRIFLTSKFSCDDVSAQAMSDGIDASLSRLQTDYIDLYYIHWPRTGKDLRPWMEALEIAREQGKIRAIGVSNFSIDQMKQLSEVGRIDAHQLGYNLLWRFDEHDLIPYCAENNIAVVVYSALAHGILAGNYQRQLDFIPGDQRWSITLFRDSVWPNVYEATKQFKTIARRAGRSLAHLAIRWLLQRPGVTSVLVSAKNAEQALSNIQALDGDIPNDVFDELTAISDRAMQHIPDEGNPFGYHP
jgi:myo-inositol catabolism protein IolS